MRSMRRSPPSGFGPLFSSIYLPFNSGRSSYPATSLRLQAFLHVWLVGREGRHRWPLLVSNINIVNYTHHVLIGAECGHHILVGGIHILAAAGNNTEEITVA